MTRVLFVHGTMTRYDADFIAAKTQIQARLQEQFPGLAFDAPPWGEYWGAKLNLRGVTFPGYDEQVGPDVLGGTPLEARGGIPDLTVTLWSLLYEEPSSELYLLAAGAAQPSRTRQSDASAALASALHLLAAQGPQPPLIDLLVEGEIDPTFPAALQWAIDRFSASDLQLQTALRSISDQALSDYRSALARAIVADAMRRAVVAKSYPVLFADARLRDRVVEAVEFALGRSAVLGSWKDAVVDAVTAPIWVDLTRYILRPNRASFTKMALRFLGDIFAYQARRLEIQRVIAERIGEQPTVLLAHSLGGIICADLLLTDEAIRARVPLLVTVGTQAGTFHEIGALGSLRAAGPEPSPLPPGFPPWLNLYDRNDMLGFRVAPVFAGVVRDVELLDGGQPFPHAHSAYWWNDTVWKHILDAIADPTNVPFQLR